MEYSKALKTIKVTTRSGEVFTASDTLDKPIASNAFWEFEKFGTMHILAEPSDFVPFHAVEMLELTLTAEQTQRKDPYCEPSGSAKACEAKACESQAGC